MPKSPSDIYQPVPLDPENLGAIHAILATNLNPVERREIESTLELLVNNPDQVPVSQVRSHIRDMGDCALCESPKAGHGRKWNSNNDGPLHTWTSPSKSLRMARRHLARIAYHVVPQAPRNSPKRLQMKSDYLSKVLTILAEENLDEVERKQILKVLTTVTSPTFRRRHNMFLYREIPALLGCSVCGKLEKYHKHSFHYPEPVIAAFVPPSLSLSKARLYMRRMVETKA